MKVSRFEHRFVEHFPDQLEQGLLYVSLPFASVAHGCACGCGREVITPLSPAEWRLTFDGKTISLNPSIGNWSFPCRSHYWIKQGTVHWSYDMSCIQIEAGRKRAQAARNTYYGEQAAPDQSHSSPTPHGSIQPAKKSRWARFAMWLNGK